jgi:hypothetical protein
LFLIDRLPQGSSLVILPLHLPSYLPNFHLCYLGFGGDTVWVVGISGRWKLLPLEQMLQTFLQYLVTFHGHVPIKVFVAELCVNLTVHLKISGTGQPSSVMWVWINSY